MNLTECEIDQNAPKSLKSKNKMTFEKAEQNYPEKYSFAIYF